MISFKIFKLLFFVILLIQSFIIQSDTHFAKIKKKGNLLFFPENFKKISENLWILRTGDVFVITLMTLILLEAYQPDFCYTTGSKGALVRLFVCTHWSLNAAIITLCLGVIYGSAREYFMSDEELKLQARFECFSTVNVKVKELYKKSYSFWFGWSRPIDEISRELKNHIK